MKNSELFEAGVEIRRNIWYNSLIQTEKPDFGEDENRMKHPDKWRDTVDPFTLPYHSFKPLEILGYPHAGNDVFHVRGLYNGSQINAYIKSARQKGADIGNELSILSQFSAAVTPSVMDYSLEEPLFLVTQELSGERLSAIVGENCDLESLSYMAEYGAALAKIHEMDIHAKPVKDRKFFHAPSDALLESLKLEHLRGLFPTSVTGKKPCFCHGDFHYANVLWENHHISGILDFELSGYGCKEFDIAWAVFVRPGQKFLKTEAELQEFLKGYRQFGVYDTEAVKIYMAQCYVYFLSFCGDDPEYCAYVREWLNAFAAQKCGK